MSDLPPRHPDAVRAGGEPTLFPGERLLIGAIRAWAAARRAGTRPHSPVTQVLARRPSPRVASSFVACRVRL